MNIFVLDETQSLAAKYHTDSHVVKMVLESAQILSTVCAKAGQSTQYRPTHKNHPCVLWAGESLDNWLWLRELAYHLNNEYRFRFDHYLNHKSFNVINKLTDPDIPSKGLTPFALAMPDQYRSSDPVQSYRNYYNGTKRHLFKWKNRNTPYWIEETI